MHRSPTNTLVSYSAPQAPKSHKKLMHEFVQNPRADNIFRLETFNFTLGPPLNLQDPFSCQSNGTQGYLTNRKNVSFDQ